MAGGTLNSRSVLTHTFGNATGTSVGLVNAFGSTAFANMPALGSRNERAGVYALLVTVSAAVTLTVQDSAGTPLSQAFQLAANGSIALDVTSNGDPWFQSSPGLGLQLALSASATVGFDVYWMPTL